MVADVVEFEQAHSGPVRGETMFARFAWAALALAAVSPSLACAQEAKSSPPPANDSAMVQSAQQWVGQVAAFTSRYQAALVRQEEALTAVNVGVNTALGFFNRSQIKEGAAWALDWAKARRVELASIKDLNDALPKYPPPLPFPIASDASLQKIDRGVRELAVGQADQAREGLELGEQLISLAERTASGDAEAASQLNGRRFEVVIINVRAENALIRTSNAMLSPGDPELDIAKSVTETNLAMIDLMQIRKSQALKDGQDVAPMIAEMRQHAQAGVAAAQQAPLDASSRLTSLRSSAELAGSVLLVRLEKAEATYAESAQVEEGVSNAMLTVADTLAKGQETSSGPSAAALDQIGPLVQRRVELDQRRKQILAGQD
jgi:hypothetical protein